MIVQLPIQVLREVRRRFFLGYRQIVLTGPANVDFEMQCGGNENQYTELSVGVLLRRLELRQHYQGISRSVESIPRFDVNRILSQNGVE